MNIEERLESLALHGIGCPQAVKLGGPAAVEAWCEQMETGVEAAAADAEAAAEAEAVAVADAEAERDHADAERNRAAEAAAAEAAEAGDVVVTGSDPEPDGPFGIAGDGPPVGDMSAAIPSILDRLDALESAVDALAVSGPPVEAVEAVAASPKPKGKGKGKGKK